MWFRGRRSIDSSIKDLKDKSEERYFRWQIYFPDSSQDLHSESAYKTASTALREAQNHLRKMLASQEVDEYDKVMLRIHDTVDDISYCFYAQGQRIPDALRLTI